MKTKQSPLPHHFAAYDGKLVPMDYVITKPEKTQFHLSAMRILDNGFDGFVITPKGELFEVKRGRRLARKIVGSEYALVLLELRIKLRESHWLQPLVADLPRMSCAQRQRQRVSFAYGNVALSNPRVTRALVEEVAAVDCPCCSGRTEGLSASDKEIADAGDCYCPEGCPNA